MFFIVFTLNIFFKNVILPLETTTRRSIIQNMIKYNPNKTLFLSTSIAFNNMPNLDAKRTPIIEITADKIDIIISLFFSLYMLLIIKLSFSFNKYLLFLPQMMKNQLL